MSRTPMIADAHARRACSESVLEPSARPMDACGERNGTGSAAETLRCDRSDHSLSGLTGRSAVAGSAPEAHWPAAQESARHSSDPILAHWGCGPFDRGDNSRGDQTRAGLTLPDRIFLLLVLLWAMIVALSSGGTGRADDTPADKLPSAIPAELPASTRPLSHVAYHSPRRPAPELQVTAWVDESGPVAPPELRGKVQLVVFWGVTCPACVQKIPKVREAAARHAGSDLVVIGLHNAQGSPARVAQFARTRHLNYPIAIDRTAGNRSSFGMTTDAYDVPAIPRAAVIDRDGTLQYVGDFDHALQTAEELLNVTSS